MLSIFLTLVVVGLVCGEQSHEGHEDFGDYGHYTTWRKAICEKDDQEMYKEMDGCFLLEEKQVLDATTECMKEAAPSVEGGTVEFMNAACKDIKLFHKFDDCFDEYEANPAFKLEITPEIEKCYGDIFDKYALESLKEYLKDLSE